MSRTPARSSSRAPAGRSSRGVRPSGPRGRAGDPAVPPGGQFGAIEGAVRRVLPCLRPADVVLREYFREHPEFGRRDRARIAQVAFGALRHKRRLEHLAVGGPGPRERLLALLALRLVAGDKACAGVVARDADLAAWLAGLAPAFDDPARAAALAPAVRYSLPDWLHDRLLAQWPRDEVDALGASMLETAPLDLRVNTLKADPAAAIEALAADGVVARPLPHVPGALRVEGHPALERSKAFEDGWVEVQDAGSQWLASLVGARRGETVIDFCAGAGGKTLALAAAMRGGGQVFAIDVSESRLARLKPRLARAGATNVQPLRIDSETDPRLSRLAGRADRVLVDAPCSGTGTLRRNPDLKWKQGPRDLAELSVRQGNILAAAAKLVRPGGRLVYATCSLLDEENDAVARTFLAAHPEFRSVPAARGDDGAPADVAAPAPIGRMLLPHRDDCDGFYAAVFERAR